MIKFIKNLYTFVRPYRTRLALGVFIGILAGLVEPLAIVVFTGVFHLIFSPEEVSVPELLAKLPDFARQLVPQVFVVPSAWA
jgi:hypothetical protein